MKSPVKAIIIHQTLHGYSEGHRLLASSLRLPPKSEAMVANMSDLSGPEMIPGFETYLTGYHIPELKKYAFSRTWYANEMPRPGCVWTHTLLIDLPDLASIPDLSRLEPLFVRPNKNKPDWLNPYREQAMFNVQQTDQVGSPKESKKLDDREREGLILALYTESDKGVVIFTPDHTQYEKTVLALWSQQWPRLRRSFSFCTGALSPRRIEEKEFDLQIAPESLLHQFERLARTRRGLLLIPDSKQYRAKIEKNRVPFWVDYIAWDLDGSYSGSLRDFLWQTGIYVENGRRAFAVLAEVFGSQPVVQSPSQAEIYQDEQVISYVSEIISFIGEKYPRVDEEKPLKVALLGEAKADTGLPLLRNAGETYLLAALIMTPLSCAFDSVSLNIKDRAARLVTTDPQRALRIADQVLEGEVSALGQDYLKGVAEEISAESLAADAVLTPSTAMALIKLRSSWLKDQAFWEEVSKLRLSEFAHSILDKLDETALLGILPFLSLLDDDNITLMLSQRVSPELLVPRIIEWLNEGEAIVWRPQAYWYRILSAHLTDVVDACRKVGWESLQKNVLIILSILLDPHDYWVRCSGAEIWEQILEVPKNILTDAWLRSRAFLLALGFHNPLPSGAKLVAGSLADIYDAAKYETLPREAWRLLDWQAPSETLIFDWDKCKRISFATIKYFIRNEWPDKHFIAAIRSVDMWKQMLDCANESNKTRKFMRYLRERIRNGEIKIPRKKEFIY